MLNGKVIGFLMPVAILTLFFLGCEKEWDEPYTPVNWITMGWEAWKTEDYAKAEEYFNVALQEYGESYMPTYNGLGWTYMRLHDEELAADYFQDGILYGANYSDSNADKRALYIGLAYTLLAADDFDGSIIAGEHYLSMDPPPETTGGAGGTWVHTYDARLTSYDVYIALSLGYFAEGNSDKCVDMVHYMQRMISETPEYEFTTWSDLAAKIEEMVGKDPS